MPQLLVASELGRYLHSPHPVDTDLQRLFHALLMAVKTADLSGN
jgi:hypothetical protein